MSSFDRKSGDRKSGDRKSGDRKRKREFSSKKPEAPREVDAFTSQLSPSNVHKRGSHMGISRTVSLAIPSSALSSAQSRELRSYLVSQIARAAVLHEIDEIIIFVDTAQEAAVPEKEKTPAVFFCRLLQYLECPAYLRKAFFPVHSDLALAGILPQLDTPHHMRRDAISLYREGVVVEDKAASTGCYVNVGLAKEAFLPVRIRPGLRVTVQLTNADEAAANPTLHAKGQPVPPTTVRTKHGIYWGYKTRLAKSFHEILSQCPYIRKTKKSQNSEVNDGEEEIENQKANKGYDFLIGHSVNGESVNTHLSKHWSGNDSSLDDKQHILIVFGGNTGIENCIDADETLPIRGRDADTLFNLWLDLCPQRGSRQVRTEEAVMCGLASLAPIIKGDKI